MNYDLKLALLANELKATSQHANEVFAEFIATAIEKEVMNAIDKLSDDDKLILLMLLMMEGEIKPEDFIEALENAM